MRVRLATSSFKTILPFVIDYRFRLPPDLKLRAHLVPGKVFDNGSSLNGVISPCL